MAITFALRGNSVNARFSTGGKTPGFFTQPDGFKVASVNSAQSGMIGSSYLDHFSPSVGRHGLLYSGQNLWSGQPFSILWRGARKTGGDLGMFSIRGASSEAQGSVQMFRNSGAQIYFSLSNDNGVEMLGQDTVVTDLALNTFHDIVMTCTGTTAANGLKIYKDGALVGSFTLTAAATATKDKGLSTINLCMVPNLLPTGNFVEEFVIWDSVIDPTSVALTSGTGSLNGAARTAFVDVASFDGQLNIDPGVGNVVAGTSYTIAGNALTGALEVLTSLSEVTVYTTATSNNAQGQPVPIVRGEDRDIRLSLVRSDATAYDLTTATAITVKIIGKYNLIQKTGIAITSPAAGQIQFNLSDAETDLLKIANNQAIEITVDVGSTRRIFIAERAFSVTDRLIS